MRARKLLATTAKISVALLAIFAVYLLIMMGIVVWAFEVKLQRWPLFLSAAPFTLYAGDNIESVGLMERLKAMGYVEGSDLMPEPGEWTRSGSRLRIWLAHCPIRGQGIASGPVQISLDWKRVRAIRLMRSGEDVDHLILEPELLDVIPATGFSPQLCRPCPLKKIQPVLVAAIVLTEDARFLSHHGIDLVSIRHALKTNIRAGRYVHGASTITQQLIRMTLLSPAKTLWRKSNEIVLAVLADALYDKETILQAYLNRVYFGQWGTLPVKGVGEAARLFFGQDQAHLNPAQCALLAAMIKAPNVINPRRHPARARSRRNMILERLLKAGDISREEYDTGIDSPVKMRRPGQPPVRTGGFLSLVRERITRDARAAHLRTDGQDLLTSLDPLIQREAYLTLKRLGPPGGEAYFILANPQTGVIRAMISPSPMKWSGEGGNLETLLPLVVLAALIPDSNDEVGYTLTSSIPLSDQTGDTSTFRNAFYAHRKLLIEKLIESIGAVTIANLLREFGIQVTVERANDIIVRPLRPMDMAQIYSILATLGNAGALRPGIRTIDGVSLDSPRHERRVAVDPAVLFLVNHLLKKQESIAIRDGRPDFSWALPSLFVASDETGTWSIAYRRDVLLLFRIPGKRFDKKVVQAMVDRVLEMPAVHSGNPFSIPAGLVFRKICVESGLRATSLCPRIIREPFLKGSQPLEWCPLRHN
ncbi:MAG: transglycosylase domain-containing protein [Deltaproteobacteria bacterium]